MPKTTAVVIALCIFFTGHMGWAQLSSAQEKRLKNLEAKEEAWKEWEESRDRQKEVLVEPESLEKIGENIQPGKQSYQETLSEGIVGRFQSVRMDSNAIFIIDTMEGHLWVWVIQNDSAGQPAEFLFYQGQVTPGSNMGELINRTFKKTD
ncbi:hypothetical protein OAC89_04855 [Deltaproteobacteria bacterium]|nr:hypothetical protein [Deltaproteobacteria bacterium]